MSCYKKVVAFAKEQGIEASKSFLKEIATRLDNIQGESLTPSEFASKAQIFIDEEIGQISLKARASRAIDLGIRERNLETIKTNVSEYGFKGHEAVIAWLNGSSVKEGQGVNIDPIAMQRGIKGNLLQILKSDIKDILKELTTGAHDKDALIELNALQRKLPTGTTKNPTALKFAESVHTTIQEIFNRKKAVSPFLEELEGYLIKQMHSWEKVGAVTEDQWVLDAVKAYGKKSFPELSSGDKIKEFRSIYKRIVSGTYGFVKNDDKAFGSTPIGQPGGGNIMAKFAKERVLIAETPQATFEYNQKYGYGNVMETVEKMIDNSSRDITRLEKFGSVAREGYEGILKRTHDSLPEEARAEFLSKRPEMDRNFNTVMGAADAPAIGTQARAVQGALTLQYLAKGGLAAPRSLSDVIMATMAVKDTTGTTLLGNASQIGIEFAKGLMSSNYAKQGLEHAQLFFQESAKGIFEGWGANEMGKLGQMSRAAELMGSLSLLKRVHNAMTNATATVLMRQLSQMTETEWAGLGKQAQSGLTRYGFNQNKWNLVRRATEDWGNGKSFLTPESIAGLPDELVENYLRKEKLLEGNATKPILDRARNQLVQDLGAMVNDHVARGTSSMNSGQKAFLYGGNSINDGQGQFWRLLLQFKSASLANFDTYRRSYYSSQSLSGAMVGITGAMVMSMFLTQLGDTIVDVAAGKTPESWDPVKNPKYYVKNLLSSGAGGLYADAVANAMDSQGAYGISKSLGKSALGPTFGTAVDALSVAGQGLQGGKFKAPATSFVMKNLPGQNLLPIHGMMSYYFGHSLHQFMDSGYLYHLEQGIRQHPGMFDEKQQLFAK